MLLLALMLIPAALIAAPSIYGEALAPVMLTADENELLPVVIMLSPEPSPQEMAQYLEGVRNMEQRRTLLWDELSARAEAAQDEILDILYAEVQTGDAIRIRSLILANAVAVDLKPATIRELALRPEVRIIEYTPSVNALEPVESSGNELDQLTWHVQQVNAPDVWDMGYTGEGIIVAVMDTGVNYNHNDIVNQLWDGSPTYPNHGYDVYHNDDDPWDYHGHGTHVAGIVAGDGTSGWETGVAPDAIIMCVKVYSDGGSSSLPDVWAGIDFALQNGAHHTTVSSGWYNQSNAIHQSNRNNYELARLAGMTNTKSAGNSGGSGWNVIPEQISAPGWVPSPWHNPDQTEPGGVGGLTVVGSTNSNDNISSYSSRGPVTWENISPWFDYQYNGGASQGLIKPDVSAPGEDVLSLDYNGNSGYTTMSGTSMASPCAAGVIALIRSVNPALSPAEIDDILQTTAVDLGTAGKDNTFGAGRVDAFEAVLAAGGTLNGLNVTLNPQYEPFYIDGNGGTVTFDVNITNYFETPTPGDVWTEGILPNGNLYPIQVYNVTFQPGTPIIVNGAQQYVPGNAPVGTYQYVLKAGTYPNDVLDSDSFEIIKLAAGTDGVGEWTQNGFEQLMGEDVATVETAQPSSFELLAAYPNPFNPTTNLSVALPDAGALDLRVYNAVGQEVASLANGQFNAGQHSFTFDGSGLASGLYFVSAQFDGSSAQVQKLVLMK